MPVFDFENRCEIVMNSFYEIGPDVAQRTTGNGSTGILAFFATLPYRHRRAKFTKPLPESRKRQKRSA
jgi:hypothetical protein